MKIFADILGYIATVALVLSFQNKKEKTLFIFQIISGFFFVLHYGLNGNYTGMAMDGICFIRALFLYTKNKCLCGKISEIVLLIIIIGLGVWTYDGFFTIFPTIALFASTIATYTNNSDKIRLVEISITSPSWLTYNIYVLSIPGIICESLNILSVIIYYIRSSKKQK